MTDPIEAAAVVLPQAGAPRSPKPTDHLFKIAFRVLPDEEAFRRLPFSGDAQPLPPDPDDGAQYAPNLSGGGLGVYGELRSLRGRHLRRGDFVKMRIQTGRQRASIRCLGLVAWVRVNQDAGLYSAGVGFVGVDPRDLKPG